jgi:hypothetical protein
MSERIFPALQPNAPELCVRLNPLPHRSTEKLKLKAFVGGVVVVISGELDQRHRRSPGVSEAGMLES